MRRGLTRSLLPLAALALSAAVVPATAAAAHPLQDPIPIGPREYFKGIFNGHPPGPAIIFVSCSVGATTGHPIAGQKLWVTEIPAPSSLGPDIGYTGSRGRSINASFVPSASTTPVAHFTGYNIKKNIPTSITVPCSGSGTIAFAPVPTSKTAHTAQLAVTFGPPPVP